jgi:hypothetical protein
MWGVWGDGDGDSSLGPSIALDHRGVIRLRICNIAEAAGFGVLA